MCYKLTDCKPKEFYTIEPLSCDAQARDISRFICDVTSQVQVGHEQLPEEAISITELAERAGVSMKTLHRWRKLGLAMRTISSDQGTRSRVVLTKTWDRFVDRNEKLVARAAAFSRLSVSQRRRVVRQARKLFGEQGLSRHQIEQVLGSQIGRACETIRYILVQHDATAQAAERIFPVREKVTAEDRKRMWEMYRKGRSARELAHIFGRSSSSIYRIIHSVRQEHWLAVKLEYMYSPEFDMPDAAETILPASEFDLEMKEGSKHPQILTKVQERSLFRAYNFIKWRQSEMLKNYAAQSMLAGHVLDQLEASEAQALSLRTKLVLCNQALIVNIAKRHFEYGVSLEELVSEGMTPLLKSIEKFDYTKGFKFSTYASWAIMKHFARVVPQEGEHHRRYVLLSDEDFDAVLPQIGDVDEEGAYRRSIAVQNALTQLNDREKHILANRYNLDRSGDPMSLSALGKVLGVSKERVRQIESKAISKMHDELKDQFPLSAETSE